MASRPPRQRDDQQGKEENRRDPHATSLHASSNPPQRGVRRRSCERDVRGEGGPKVSRRRKYSGSGWSSVISGPTPAKARTWSSAIQTSLGMSAIQPARLFVGVSDVA